jgi:hypothetical protein
LIVYIREAHALDSRSPMYTILVEDPTNLDERLQIAKTCMTKLALEPIPAVVDRLDDKTNKTYAGWPDRLYLVGKNGLLAYTGERGPFGFKPAELEAAIRKELRSKGRKQ